eukprot:611932-Hanusia_phi.AAC.1
MVIRHVSDRAEPRRTRHGREFASDRRTVRNILSRTREIKNRQPTRLARLTLEGRACKLELEMFLNTT